MPSAVSVNSSSFIVQFRQASWIPARVKCSDNNHNGGSSESSNDDTDSEDDNDNDSSTAEDDTFESVRLS
ncbi:MAG: hypothetical protein J3Q66DRAFT_403813 [Benniella sp.]|nr:MAG: hypothetical protein J3Q66DRAFT_403813 [Benniella sp.]